MTQEVTKATHKDMAQSEALDLTDASLSDDNFLTVNGLPLVVNGTPTKYASGPFWELLTSDQSPIKISGHMENPDLEREGGFLSLNEKVFYVRGPFWRASEGDSTVRIPDAKPIFFAAEKPNFSQSHVGGELELFTWQVDKTDTYPVMTDGSQIVAELEYHNHVNDNGNTQLFEFQPDYTLEIPTHLGFSSELMQQMIEINFMHDNDPAKRGVAQLQSLRKLSQICNRNGVYILPISTLPHRPLEKHEVSNDPYVRRIALKHMTWEKVRHFLGASFQTHVEIFETQAGLRTINYLQQVSPLLLGLSCAGPFVNGKINLSEEELPNTGSKKDKYHSTRYLLRKIGSPSGGVIQIPAPDTLEEYHWLASRRLRHGDIMSPARTFGHHVSFRFREDIPPTGTIEYADPDTFGAHPVKLAAFQELNKALTLKIQYLIYSGRENELPTDFFSELDLHKLREVEEDMIKISKQGFYATVRNGQGKEVNAQSQFLRLLEWVNEPLPEMNYPGLTESVLREMRHSAILLNEETFQQFNPEASDFLINFYTTRLGTLSQWLHRRVTALSGSIEDEQQIVKQTMNELALVFADYLNYPDLETQIINLFRLDNKN